MGSDICTCLNDLTGGESEDLSRLANDNNNAEKKDKKPKVVLKKDYSLDSCDPLQSQRENNISVSTNLNSDYKNTLPNHQQKSKNPENKKIYLKKNLSSNATNINNNKKNSENIDSIININNTIKIENNNNNIINNINNNEKNKDLKNIKTSENKNTKNNIINKNIINIEKKEEEVEEEINIDFEKFFNREEMVSENFNKFFNSQQGQAMILNMNEPKNKICITLHKYFVSLITRRKYKQNIKTFQKEKMLLHKKCLNMIYKANPFLKKLEKVTQINYTPDGFKKYYPEEKDIEKMKFIPQKESFDNCLIIFYEDDDSSSIDNMLWIYQGQVNRKGDPHGFGEKIYKNGIKEKGYWKEGEFFGWSMKYNSTNKDIFIGPFYGDKGLSGLGEKFTWKKKLVYKGEFIDGEKSGKGEEDSNEGKFVGNFYHDKKNGKGKMFYKISGDIYEGDYKNDLFDGQGHYIWKLTGQEYTGEYKNGQMHGKGLYEWSEGEFYKGNFVNGKKEGEGELHWGNGRSYIGQFSNGRPNGIGIYDNGINFRGEMEFVDGKMNINYLKRNYSHSSMSTINQNDVIENIKEELNG